MARPSLPVNIDSSYADDATRPSVKLHQQYHDALHKLAVLLDDVTGQPLAVTNSQTGSAYTLVLSDEGRVVERSNASANTLTVPTNTAVPFPIGSRIWWRQGGAGRTAIAAASGVTIVWRGVGLLGAGQSAQSGGQYAEGVLTKTGTNTWVLSGDLIRTSFDMVSPDGSRFQVTVDDTGHLNVTEVAG